MACSRNWQMATVAGLALALSACGGDSGGIASVASAPVPAPVPPSDTAPPPAPPPPPGPNGLISDKPFAATGISQSFARTENATYVPPAISLAPVQIRYVATSNAYDISLPGFETGRLKVLSYNGDFGAAGWRTVSGTYNAVTKGVTEAEQGVRVMLARPAGPLNPEATLTYTSWGNWESYPYVRGEQGSGGQFAYGIPTAPGDVPVSGSGSYTANVAGTVVDPKVISAEDFGTTFAQGSAKLNFDFGGGTLSGNMQATICSFDCIALPQYDFTQTVYAKGSTSFSGKFLVPGSTADSFFEGSFNGPQAAELMARWQAPFQDPDTKEWRTMFGIWTGKKD